MAPSSPSNVVDDHESSAPANPFVGTKFEDWFGQTCIIKPKRARPSSPKDVLNAVLIKADQMWDNGAIIPFCFVKPSGTKSQRNKVTTTVKEWEKYANVKFKLVDKPASALVRIAFNPAGGAWSLVARDVDNYRAQLSEPTMNLGNVSTSQDLSDEERGVILHEFGHVLGFLHEHQSLRLGEVMKLRRAEVMEFYTEIQGWTPEQVDKQLLEEYNEKDVSNYSAVDLKSIMIYFMPASMNDKNIMIRPNFELSEKDKAFAFINYPYMTKPSPDPEWNIEKALTVAGVNEEAKGYIMAEFKQNDWRGVRSEFTLFCMNERAQAMLVNLRNKRLSEPAVTESEVQAKL